MRLKRKYYRLFTVPRGKIQQLSIKQLTILGFALVALPLVCALLYSAVKVQFISQQGTDAIFDVAQLIKTNRELNENRINIERFASQYTVLSDHDLFTKYQQQASIIPNTLAIYLSKNANNTLSELSLSFLERVEKINALMQPSANKERTLAKLQPHFLALANINDQITFVSNQSIVKQAKTLKLTAEKVSYTLLQSLFIIPLVVLIALFFIQLITKPLKVLTHQIQRIEHGNLNKKITISGSSEVTDIAKALELMRTRLHALELQKSSFIRHISHELKTPLAAIREGAELLYDHSVGPLNPDQQEISQIIRASVAKLQTLIEDLLSFNVVLDSTSLQDSKKLALSNEIDQVLNDRKLAIKRKSIVINRQLENIAIYSNAKQLNVIIDNIISNAIKYSPMDGVITIEGELHREQLTLTITDQGPGIAATQQEKIFDAFYQGTPPQEQNIKGSGLGLTIVKELVMRLNGNIFVNSTTTIPSGTAVILTLPRAFIANDK